MRADVDKAISDLTAIRKMRGMSLEDVAGMTEINLRSLQYFERRKRMPSALTLSRWAEVFDARIMIMPKE